MGIVVFDGFALYGPRKLRPQQRTSAPAATALTPGGGGETEPVSGVFSPRPVENREGAPISDVFPNKNPE